MLTSPLKLEKMPPYPCLVALHLTLNLHLQVLELLACLGIDLIHLSNVVNLLESPFEVGCIEDLTVAWNNSQLLSNRACVQLEELYWLFYYTAKHILQVFLDFRDIMLFGYIFERLNNIERCLHEWDILVGTNARALVISKAPVCFPIIHEHWINDCGDLLVNI